MDTKTMREKIRQLTIDTMLNFESMQSVDSRNVCRALYDLSMTVCHFEVVDSHERAMAAIENAYSKRGTSVSEIVSQLKPPAGNGGRNN